MTHAPRRLLLVASDATPRGSAAPIRRYRLGRVLMGPEQLIEVPPAGGAPDREARRRPGRDGRLDA